MRVPFPASSGEETRHSRRTSRGGALNLKVERNSRCHATIPKDPFVPVYSRYTSFPCSVSTVTPSIDSQHNGMFDSPVEPQEKATNPMSTRQEAGHYCYSSRGKWSCMPPHKTRPDSPVETPREPRVSCHHWRGNLRFWPQLQMRN